MILRFSNGRHALRTISALLLILAGYTGRAQAVNPYGSVYQTRLDDTLAIYFTPENFGIRADGSTDVSDALQQAINRVQETVRYGVLFIPEGTYPISKTIYIWKGIRLIGYGKNRPEFVLKENSPGFQSGRGKYLFHFVSDRPRRSGSAIPDANAGTFYSGIRNIDISIGAGNPAAIAARFHIAQHSFLSHMDFRLSGGNTGIEDIGNEIEYCRFFGGDYAIRTGKTSPGWQALLIDNRFEGQHKSAIQTSEAGLMVVRSQFKQVPTAIEIAEGLSEQLWVSDSRFQSVSGPALVISNENNVRTQVNLENNVYLDVNTAVLFRESGKQIAPNQPRYRIKTFIHGRQYAGSVAGSVVKTTEQIEPLAADPPEALSDVPMLPPTASWVNIKTLGAKGDGVTDDTEAIIKAVAGHRTIYFPSGHYRVSKPIILTPETQLVGLHPSITQLVIHDSTAAYQGMGSPVPLLETPPGGENIVTGLGLNTSGVNPRAVAAKWMAGSRSMMNDVKFAGGHGTYDMQGREVPVYNDNRTADGQWFRKWDSQYWSLWITAGGGGTFKDLWTASPYAMAGMHISNTATEGRVYYLSSEHHVRNEITIDGISNWKFFGLQLEEESGEGPFCLPLDIRNSEQLLFANFFSYRVSRVTNPFPYAVRTEHARDIVFRGAHVYSWTKYAADNLLYDATAGQYIRPRELALATLPAQAAAAAEYPTHKVAHGFESIDGAAADANGNIYFVDYRWQRIYRFDTASGTTRLISNLAIAPVLLAFDSQDHLLVVTRYQRNQTAYERGDIQAIRMNPDDPENSIVRLEEKPATAIKTIGSLLYQTARHRNENETAHMAETAPESYFVAPDGKTVIANLPDLGQLHALKAFAPGDKIYSTSGPAGRTYVSDLQPDGTLTNTELFTEEGGADIAVDAAGNVYLASDGISVYSPEGRLIRTIETPERPTALVFGGKDHQTLYACARTALYEVPLP